MAVLECREMFRGRQRQAAYGDVPVYTRIFMVKVDELDPDFQLISSAPGIAWLDAHPEDPDAYLIESNLSQDGDSPFWYKVVFTYKTSDGVAEIPWLRPHNWSFSGSLASVPAFWYYSGSDTDNDTKTIIHNSAYDPLQGLDKDEGEFTVTFTGNFAPPFPYVAAQMYVGAMNSDYWSGGGPKCWKVSSFSATRKVETVPGVQKKAGSDRLIPAKVTYYEVNVTFAYRGTTWDLQTWDVGFNQIINGVKQKCKFGGSEASEPVALHNGVQKASGEPPEMLTFRVYRMLEFGGMFPEIPDTNPYENATQFPGLQSDEEAMLNYLRVQ